MSEEEKELTIIELKPTDAAIVLREDGSMELFVTAKDDEEIVDGVTLAVSKIALTFKDPEVMDIIERRFNEIISNLPEDDEESPELSYPGSTIKP